MDPFRTGLLTVSSVCVCTVCFSSCFIQSSHRKKVSLCFHGYEPTSKNYHLVSTSIEHPIEQSTETLRMNSSLLSSMPWYTSVLRDCSVLSGWFLVAGAMEVSCLSLFPTLLLITIQRVLSRELTAMRVTCSHRTLSQSLRTTKYNGKWVFRSR